MLFSKLCCCFFPKEKEEKPVIVRHTDILGLKSEVLREEEKKPIYWYELFPEPK